MHAARRFLVAAPVVLGLGCGSRTGLPVDLGAPEPPSTSTPQCTPSPGLTVLAQAPTEMTAMTSETLFVDATNVYWVSASTEGSQISLMKVPLCGGGAPTVLVSGNVGEAFAVDSQYAYFSQGNGIIADGGYEVKKVPLGGGTPTVVASEQLPISFAVDVTNFYWSNGSTSPSVGATILKEPLTGGTPSALVTGSEPMLGGFAIDATNVYWVGPAWGIFATPLAGGQARQVVTTSTPTNALVVNGGSLFWTIRLDAPGLWTVPVSGGIPTQLTPAGFAVPSGSTGAGFAVDDASVYWAAIRNSCSSGPCNSLTGTLWRVPRGGGTPVTVASGWAAPASDNAAITTDDTSVYWVTGNTVYRQTPK
jgi:hypothetical protein